MKTKEILKEIINNFDINKFNNFFRLKNDNFSFPNQDIYYQEQNLGDFTDGRKIAEAKLEDGEIIVCSFKVLKDLTERTGKKLQYILGKKILKEFQTDAGIFIFYDINGNFRFSLIYVNYSGKNRSWSSFKRFTYFVSSRLTNKTFINQIGDADFSTLEKIKKAFEVEPVTKQFYNEIQNWYFWAMDKVEFPNDYKYSSDSKKDLEIRNSTNLIRLITRIMFIWFIKEKGIIPDDLFSKEKLKKIVKDFCKNKSSSNFYNAILQNLFFATLNRKMNERKFVDETIYPATKKEYGVKTLYRYSDKFLISKDEVLELFKDIPFLNGGLFDCLDKEDETGKVIYIDGFSRNKSKQAIIPDYLFFQEEEENVDLSEYGLGNRKVVRGLFEILKSYNFTIDENTPIDQEIALDPELLGKVFENLLASYNPETAKTARKESGSYYTPREIVDYMVDASLLEYIKTKIPQIEEEKIKLLLSYSEEIPQFSEEEKNNIISAINEIKVLDPACGSGAFPMGVLHKLVFILQKLDPENNYWYKFQLKNILNKSKEALDQKDDSIKKEILTEINNVFDETINYPDYARKLYLIENCIYGVDIQPIAIQISKLRFFISLILDQKIDKTKENLGIRALPNLETKFVSANTLLNIEKPDNLFYTEDIRNLEEEIKKLRHKYFQAKTRTEKLNCQKKDKELREKLAKRLIQIGFSNESSKKIAKFDMFDQNASSDWFDPEWMFGVTDGFDIVIGNPPYIRQEDIKELKPLLEKENYEVYNSTSDIYTYFYEKGIKFLKDCGVLSFITSNKWMRAKYGEKLRKFFKEKTSIKQIIDFNGYQVFDATVDTNIIILKKLKPIDNEIDVLNIELDFNKDTDINEYFELHSFKMKQNDLRLECYTFANEYIIKLKEKIENVGKPLKDWNVKIYRGILTGFNEAFIVDSGKKQEILNNCKDNEEKERTKKLFKPILRGRDIDRYYYKWAGLWLIKIESGWTNRNRGRMEAEKFFKMQYPAIYNHLISFKKVKSKGKGLINRDDKGDYWWELRDCDYYDEFEKEKIVWNRITELVIFSIIDKNYYLLDSTFFMISKNLKYIAAILNSKISIFWMEKSLATLGEGMYGAKIYIEKIPIPEISEREQKPFIELVNKILSITDDEDYTINPRKQAEVKKLENQIDQMVYKLYNLTDDEIKIIESSK